MTVGRIFHAHRFPLTCPGQHNDSRMNVSLALTAVQHGAIMANHVEVTKLHKRADASRGGAERIYAADVKDQMTGESWTVKCRVSLLSHIGKRANQLGCRQRYWPLLGRSKETRRAHYKGDCRSVFRCTHHPSCESIVSLRECC
jgi:hypothetical protein